MSFYYQSLKETQETQISIVKKKKKKKKKTVWLLFQHDKTKQYKSYTTTVLYTYAYTIREEREVNLLTVKPETCRTQP